MEKEVFICQSCAMPMENEEDFGTEDDGGRNQEYCKYCFQEGGFTNPGISVEEMTERLIELAEKMGRTKEETKKMAEETLPKLKRWE